MNASIAARSSFESSLSYDYLNWQRPRFDRYVSFMKKIKMALNSEEPKPIPIYTCDQKKPLFEADKEAEEVNELLKKLEFSPLYCPTNSRDASNVFNDEESSPKYSIAVHAWKEITDWRAKENGSVCRKVIAEVGYFGAGLTGIIELPCRFAVSFIVGNSAVDKLCSFLKSEWYGGYKAFKNGCENGFKRAVQGIAQNFSSLATNPVSHELNISCAKAIKSASDDPLDKVVKVTRAISPLGIFWALYKNEAPTIPIGIGLDIAGYFEDPLNSLMSQDGYMKYPIILDPRPTSRLIKGISAFEDEVSKFHDIVTN